MSSKTTCQGAKLLHVPPTWALRYVLGTGPDAHGSVLGGIQDSDSSIVIDLSIGDNQTHVCLAIFDFK